MGFDPVVVAGVGSEVPSTFSYWMTMMLHHLPDESDFDVHRQRAELASLVECRAGSTFLAEGYTGWPM